MFRALIRMGWDFYIIFIPMYQILRHVDVVFVELFDEAFMPELFKYGWIIIVGWCLVPRFLYED